MKLYFFREAEDLTRDETTTTTRVCCYFLRRGIFWELFCRRRLKKYKNSREICIKCFIQKNQFFIIGHQHTNQLWFGTKIHSLRDEMDFEHKHNRFDWFEKNQQQKSWVEFDRRNFLLEIIQLFIKFPIHSYKNVINQNMKTNSMTVWNFQLLLHLCVNWMFWKLYFSSSNNSYNWNVSWNWIFKVAMTLQKTKNYFWA